MRFAGIYMNRKGFQTYPDGKDLLAVSYLPSPGLDRRVCPRGTRAYDLFIAPRRRFVLASG